MNSVGSRIKSLRLNKDLNQLDLCNELNKKYDTNINKGMISKWENDKDEPSMKYLRNISDYFNVTLDYLIGNTNDVICDECGTMYSPLSPLQVREHQFRHARWKKAVEKFGFCWTYAITERVKKESIENYNNSKIPFEFKYDSVISYLRALFSESLRKNEFSLNHIDFETYVSRKLIDKDFISSITKDILDKLIDNFGIADSYKKEDIITIAAHKTNDDIDWTEEELEEIENFKKYVFSKREKKDN